MIATHQKVKTKVRFTSLDILAMVSNLQSLVGLRSTNIYDVNPSTYIIKFSKSEEKHNLIIQNGVRFHLTSDKNEKTIPSGFTMKFRKFLRSKRLESIKQVGIERVVVLSFGTETFANHLILELYSMGNIILTDHAYRIVQCIRSHEYNDKVKTAVGEIYPFEFAANLYIENIDVSEQAYEKLFAEIVQNENQSEDPKKKKKKKDKGPLKLKDTVFKMIPCLFPLAIEHILQSKEINPDEKIEPDSKDKILGAAKICLSFLKEFAKAQHIGYIFSKPKKEVSGKINEKGEKEEEYNYFEYTPFNNIKYQQFQCKKFDSFNQSVEQYYKRYKKSQHQQEEQFQQITWKKYDQIKRDQDERIKKLQQQQDIYKLKAQYIQQNVQDVDAIIKIVKTMEENGYNWDAIERMVSESKKNGDPLANMIYTLNIFKRQVTILLGDVSSEEQLFSLVPVEINIDYNAYTNATIYYESKKKNFQKEQRTKQASQQVLKIAEKDALKKIEKKKNEILYKSMPTRKMLWFEKFYWFISSEGYLIISGRDSHQNELLVKRYMKTGDLYMHSDYGGAASTIIKKHSKGIPVPRNTLEESAIFTVCRSKAWDTKIIAGSWWVYSDQVSKSAPTGEFLPTGSFMIRGKRNFINPNRMEMGLTFLYKIDDQSLQRHMNDRKIHEEEDQLFKEDQLRKVQSKQNQEQQFAIINLELEKQKFKNDRKKGKGKNPKPNSNVVHVKETQQEEKQSLSNDSNSDASDSQDEYKQFDKSKVKGVQAKNQKKNKKQQEKQIQQKHKNRNKKKLQKLQKYMDEQDEDQRQLMLKLLGAKEMKHKQLNEQTQIVDKKEKEKDKKKKKKRGIDKYIDFGGNEEEDKVKLNPDKVLFLKEKKEQSEEEQEIEILQEENQKIQNLEGSQKDENSEEQPQDQDEVKEEEVKEGQQVKEEQGKQQPKKEEEEEVDEKVLDSELGQIMKLVGKIHHQDKYLNMVAMCAPYNSIKENRFKVKLVPGGLKKGKAARNIIHYFNSLQDLSQTEKPFLKTIPEQEIINCLIGNVKLAGAGLLKIELKNKADKKVKKKEQDKKKEQ